MGMSNSLDSRSAMGVRGLSNCGLSCCVNALLQSFSATTELFELLNRWQLTDEFEAPRSVPLQLKKALNRMRDQLQLAPHVDFLNCLHLNNICQWNIQHDADEVFYAILDLIQQQMPDLSAEIKNLYKITLEGQIRCLECMYVHCVPTFLLSLPLPIPGDESSLEDCIVSFFKMQKLKASESFHCDRCDKKQPTTQGFRILSLPSILCIHLKRFRSDYGVTKKLYCKIHFPEFFRMADFLREENSTQVVLEGCYRLYAVITHSGFASSGHYSAYIHSMQDHTWYYTSDCNVHQAEWKDIQQTYGGLGDTAYILLYRRFSSETVEGAEG